MLEAPVSSGAAENSYLLGVESVTLMGAEPKQRRHKI